MGKNKSTISRRDFLKSAAIGAATVAGANLIGGIPAIAESEIVPGKIYNEPASWDYEADVVTVGTGTSMYGTTRMANEGLKVIAIDAFAVAGGSAGFSGAVLWLPNNPLSREMGDTRELSREYVVHGCGMANVKDDVIDAFLDNTTPMLEYMDPLFMESSYQLGYCVSPELGDYHPHWQGGMVEGRSVDWRPNKDNVNYNRDAVKWRAAYLEIAEKAGVQIMTSTKMTKFVYRFDEEDVPEVLGIIAEQDGRQIAIKAKKAVLFAPGGFEWNWEMQRDFSAVPDSYPCSTSTNDGTALKAIMPLGPELTNMSAQFGILTFEDRAKEQMPMGAPAAIIFQHHNPHCIMVNMEGRRFMNEAADYATQHKQFYHSNTYGDNVRTNGPCWLVCDQQKIESPAGFISGAYEGDLDERGVFPYIKSADTLEELADIMGVNKENFLAEVEKFNKFVEQGRDDDFHRGESRFDNIFFQYCADTPEDVYRTLGKIEKPPFYAGKVVPCTLGTCGGPRINGKAQVMHVSGKPIARLYGCGNGTGCGGPGTAYGGAGGTLGIGFTMGFIAGGEIVENVKEDWA
ncbi:MAG: FAD-binding protein [Clostridia bacterium]|nr:FAD-binding protein [Clostridia bacterium]